MLSGDREVRAEQNNPTSDHKFHEHGLETGWSQAEGLGGEAGTLLEQDHFLMLSAWNLWSKGGKSRPMYPPGFSFGIIYEQAVQ